MAVARPELTIPELRRMVELAEAAGDHRHIDYKRGARECRRALARAEAQQAREEAHMRRVRRDADQRYADRFA